MFMEKHAVAIVGGTGSGKSTLAYALQDAFPGLIEVVHFDDYQKLEPDVPMSHGMRNWDCPDAINFNQLVHDLKKLKDGKDVKIMTKSGRHNPDYEKSGRIRLPYTMKSRKIIIIEGYVVLCDERVRRLIDYSIFLDIDIKEGLKRRNKVIDHDMTEYTNKILIPGHKKYVESTKRYADIIINIEKTGKNEMIETATQKLRDAKIL